MKITKSFSLYSSFLCALMAIGSTPTTMAEAPLGKKLLIVTTEYAPFTSEQSKYSGFVNHVVKASFSRQNVQVSFKFMPWKRVIATAQKCQADAASFSFENKQRERDFLFSIPLSEHREVLFHRKETTVPEWQRISDLNSFTFGATRGYTYTQDFWDASKIGQIDIQLGNNDDQNFKKLLAGRVDLFPVDEMTGWNILNKNFSAEKDLLTTHTKALRKTDGFLIAGRSCKKHQLIIDTFNLGLIKIKEDGTYEKMRKDLLDGGY